MFYVCIIAKNRAMNDEAIPESSQSCQSKELLAKAHNTL